MPADPAAADSALPAAVLEQAAEWLLRLHDDDSTRTRAACAQWCAEHPDHARAWQRAQRLQALVAQVPSGWALPVLGRSRGGAGSRRAAIKRIGLWLTLVPAGWAGWQLAVPGAPGQRERTAVGQRRLRILPDGSTVHLDTDTQLQVQFDPLQRQVQLVRGQILVETAPDRQSPARPFQVVTAHGQIRALGTRFNVRLDDQRTQLSLYAGSLEIRAGGSDAWRLHVGEQAWFDAAGGHAVAALDDSASAWVEGMLVADARPLGEVVAELARHRRGVLRCDPQVALLPVSGAFPLDDSDRSLALLEATYPVRVQRSPGGWWVLVAAR